MTFPESLIQNNFTSYAVLCTEPVILTQLIRGHGISGPCLHVTMYYTTRLVMLFIKNTVLVCCLHMFRVILWLYCHLTCLCSLEIHQNKWNEIYTAKHDVNLHRFVHWNVLHVEFFKISILLWTLWWKHCKPAKHTGTHNMFFYCEQWLTFS